LQAHHPATVNYVRIPVAVALASSLPIGIVYWRRLAGWVRVAFVVLVLGNLAMFVAMATNKGVGELAFLLPWLLVAGMAGGELPRRGKGLVGLLAVVVAAYALFLAFFAATMLQRHQSLAVIGELPMGAVSTLGGTYEPDATAAAGRPPTKLVVAIN